MKLKKLSLLKNFWFNLRRRSFISRYAPRYLHQDLANLFFQSLWQSDLMSQQVQVSPRRVAADLPICLVVGEGQSGKSSLLTASRHILPQSNILNTDYLPMVGRSMPRFALTSQKLFIEIPQYFFVNESSKQIPYLEQLLLFWEKKDYLPRIQQIIVTLSLSTILSNTEESRARRDEFWLSMKLLLSRMAHPVQIYLVPTELDRLQGFAEFFSDLSVEERQHAFGFSLSSRTVLADQIRQQFFTLTKRLQRRMWWRTHADHVLSRRLLVAEFPKQFDQLCESLLHYIKPLLIACQENPRIHVKGCFFTSSAQQGGVYDLLFDPNSELRLAPSQQNLPMLVQHKEYFIRGFFQQIYSQVGHIYRNEEWNTHTSKSLWKKITLGLAGLLILTSLTIGGLWWFAWSRLSTALSERPIVAYKILDSNFVSHNLWQFVSYETTFLPKFLQEHIAQSASLRQMVDKHARYYLDQAWQKQVYNVYQKNVMGKYPIEADSKQEVSVDQFNALYAPTGALENFDRQYLQSAGVQMLFVHDQTLIDLYTHLNQLRQLLYPANQLQIAFSIYPDNLAPNVRSVTFMLSGTEIILHPHSLISKPFVWPNQQLNKESGYAIQYEQSLPQMRVYNGDWSWLKLLSDMHWQKDVQAGYILTDQNHQFSVGIDTNKITPQLPNLFATLVVPQNI